jgi:hypothetical protein
VFANSDRFSEATGNRGQAGVYPSEQPLTWNHRICRSHATPICNGAGLFNTRISAGLRADYRAPPPLKRFVVSHLRCSKDGNELTLFVLAPWLHSLLRGIANDDCARATDLTPSTGFDSVSLAECVLPDGILNAAARTVISVDL